MNDFKVGDVIDVIDNRTSNVPYKNVIITAINEDTITIEPGPESVHSFSGWMGWTGSKIAINLYLSFRHSSSYLQQQEARKLLGLKD